MPEHDPLAGLSWNDLRAKPYVYPTAMHPTTGCVLVHAQLHTFYATHRPRRTLTIAQTGENAVSFIGKYNDVHPLFMKVSFHRPHSPYDPPSEWLAKYQDAVMPPPVRASTRRAPTDTITNTPQARQSIHRTCATLT